MDCPGRSYGAETGTSDVNADRRGVDRLANAFVPVALAYLLVGAYATLAAATALPSPLDGYPLRGTHLVAAGMAALLVFAVGFRLLPRFTTVRIFVVDGRRYTCHERSTRGGRRRRRPGGRPGGGDP